MFGYFNGSHPLDLVTVEAIEPLDGTVVDLESALPAVGVEHLDVSKEDEIPSLIDLINKCARLTIGRYEGAGIGLNTLWGGVP